MEERKQADLGNYISMHAILVLRSLQKHFLVYGVLSLGLETQFVYFTYYIPFIYSEPASQRLSNRNNTKVTSDLEQCSFLRGSGSEAILYY